MDLPANFKDTISGIFYDKTITKYTTTDVTDEEGWSRRSVTAGGTFLGNVRFNDLARIQEDYGLTEKIDVAITTEETIETGGVIGYGGKMYQVVSCIPFDSHNLIVGKVWSSKSST